MNKKGQSAEFDKKKILILIVALSVIAIVLVSISAFFNSNNSSNSSSPMPVTTSSNNVAIPGGNSKDATKPISDSYIYDVNGCGGKDNTVWCSTKQKCVLPTEGQCPPLPASTVNS